MKFTNKAWMVVTYLLLRVLDVYPWQYDIIDSEYYKNRVLTVTTIVIEPYVMLRVANNQTSRVSPNDLYEGYIVDLLEAISKIVNFKYRVLPAYDGQFGYKQEDGTWSGMIGELTRREVDIAAGPVYITRQRQFAVDFTTPFMMVEASVLIRRQPGKKIFHSVEELFRKSTYVFGTLNHGLIHRAFRNSNHSLYKDMYDTMQSRPSVSFTASNEEGIERVRTENYAFILQDKIADYISRRKPCDLLAIDKFLLYMGFGLAVPKGSALLPALNSAIDMLERKGDLERLYRKWWLSSSECNEVHPEKVFSLKNSSSGLRTLLYSANNSLICVSFTCLLSMLLTKLSFGIR